MKSANVRSTLPQIGDPLCRSYARVNRVGAAALGSRVDGTVVGSDRAVAGLVTARCDVGPELAARHRVVGEDVRLRERDGAPREHDVPTGKGSEDGSDVHVPDHLPVGAPNLL